MSALDLANASAHAAAGLGTKTFSAIKRAFARFGAATRARRRRGSKPRYVACAIESGARTTTIARRLSDGCRDKKEDVR